MEIMSRSSRRHGLRVLMIFRAPEGGLFRHVVELAEGLSGHGLQIAFACDAALDAHSSLGIRLLAACEGRGLRVPIVRGGAMSDCVAVWTIFKWLKTIQFVPDVYHGHGAKGGLIARLVSRFSPHSAVSIYTPHGGSLHYVSKRWLGWLVSWSERLLSKFTDGILFESQFARRIYLEHIGGLSPRHRVVYNGVFPRGGTATVGPSVKPEFDFVYLGELRRLKGLHVLIDALALAQSKGFCFSLAVYGRGPDEADFKSQATLSGLQRIVWKGYTPTPALAMATGRCLVLPSLAESLPYVVLDAAAQGIPVLCTRVGGVPEIFPERRLWVEPGDVPSLADALIRVASAPSDVTDTVQSVAVYVREHFSGDAMVDAVWSFYSELLALRMRATSPLSQ